MLSLLCYHFWCDLQFECAPTFFSLFSSFFDTHCKIKIGKKAADENEKRHLIQKIWINDLGRRTQWRCLSLCNALHAHKSQFLTLFRGLFFVVGLTFRNWTYNCHTFAFLQITLTTLCNVNQKVNRDHRYNLAITEMTSFFS